MPERGFELQFDLDIEQPPEAVFAFLVDTGRPHKLEDALVGFGPLGPLHAGSAGWFKHRRGGLTATTTFTVTAKTRGLRSSSP